MWSTEFELDIHTLMWSIKLVNKNPIEIGHLYWFNEWNCNKSQLCAYKIIKNSSSNFGMTLCSSEIYIYFEMTIKTIESVKWHEYMTYGCCKRKKISRSTWFGAWCQKWWQTEKKRRKYTILWWSQTMQKTISNACIELATCRMNKISHTKVCCASYALRTNWLCALCVFFIVGSSSH